MCINRTKTNKLNFSFTVKTKIPFICPPSSVVCTAAVWSKRIALGVQFQGEWCVRWCPTRGGVVVVCYCGGVSGRGQGLLQHG